MKLLSALDLARSSPSVLRETILWTRRLSAEVILLHVAAPDPDFMGYGARAESTRLAAACKTQHAEKQLEAIAVDLRKDGLDAVALLVHGDPADMILQEAERLHIDAILMGAHARASVTGPTVGSVTRRVLHLAARPVILDNLPSSNNDDSSVARDPWGRPLPIRDTTFAHRPRTGHGAGRDKLASIPARAPRLSAARMSRW